MAMYPCLSLPSLSFPSVSGAVCSFDSQYAGLPLKSHKIALTATQSGSGTPSPSNPRPISGYNAINISHSDADTSNPTVYTINLGGTYYGGEYDARTGVLPYPHKKRVLNGSESWYTSGSGAYIEITDAHIVNNYADCISNQYTSSTWTAVTSNTQTNYVMCIYKNASWPKARLAFNLMGESLADFKARIANDNIEVAYPEDVNLQLPPCPIDVLEGQNNIWADTGDTALQYIKFG